MRYAVVVKYEMERTVDVTARNGKAAALEALKFVSLWKGALRPEVIDIKDSTQ